MIVSNNCCIASLVLILDLFSTITSIATVPIQKQNKNINNSNQLTIGKIRDRLYAMENELEALEHQNYPVNQQNPKQTVHPSFPSNDNLEREETIPRKVKDLSNSDLHSLEEVLNDNIPLKQINYVGNKIDDGGIEEVNPLERGSTPPDVEILAPGTFSGKPGNSNDLDNLKYQTKSPVEMMGQFYEQPIVDNKLGGHIVKSHGISNQPSKPIRIKQQKGFGDFAKDGKRKKRRCILSAVYTEP